MPIGAMTAREEVARGFVPGTHAATFGGNPLATAAGLAALETTLEEGILENCREVGAYLGAELSRLGGRYSGLVKEVRGCGFIWGMELTQAGGPVVEACLKQGVLINCTADTILRFLPPLVATKHDVDEMLHVLEGAMSEMASE